MGALLVLASSRSKEHLSGDEHPPVSECALGDDKDGFYLEFLVPLVGGEVKRGGRVDATTTVSGVTAQKLRYLNILLIRPWKVRLTREDGFPVRRAREILIPNPAAYIAQKMLALDKRKPDKQAKDLLYVHDTFAMFADSADVVSSEWHALREKIVPGHVRSLEKSIHARLATVTDMVRRAARITSDRGSPLESEMLLAGLRQGFYRLFGLGSGKAIG